MYGAQGGLVHDTNITFLSQSAVQKNVPEKLGLKRRISAVKNCRNISKKDMKWNDAAPNVEIDPETYEVKVDGEVITCEPVSELPMTQKYFLF